MKTLLWISNWAAREAEKVRRHAQFRPVSMFVCEDEGCFQKSWKVGGCKQIEKLENVDSLVVYEKKHKHLNFAPVRFTVALASS